eukprot:TRINITY_DN1626_c0_g1_i3.p1 TRINITY_DN1626_c0_g1~~TRINITY_DN1626_c0_g1_i3.p1  ORF type:complete len:102 (-),score=32.16 TRINITY_DN1626_c0_g1_i3:48-332(-)
MCDDSAELIITEQSSHIIMSKEVAKPAPKVELEALEEDDEFEEFETGADNEEGEDKDDQQWEDDWDTDNVDDDFSKQLRAELEKGGHGPQPMKT